DTSSLMTPEQVSAAASEIDVPVYVVTVVSQSMHEDVPLRAEQDSPLGTLARWTGGNLFMTSAPAHQSLAGRQIVDEVRPQYRPAFAGANAKGWRPLEVKTKDKDLTVRARSGYAAGTHGS